VGMGGVAYDDAVRAASFTFAPKPILSEATRLVLSSVARDTYDSL